MVKALACLLRGRRFDSTSVVLKLGQFCHATLSLSQETFKAVGPFCLVSMPGEVKDPMQGIGKNM